MSKRRLRSSKGSGHTMRLCISILLTTSLVACAADAPIVHDTSLSDVRKGQTTLAQVIGRFGRPSILSRNMDGTQTAAYVSADTRSSTPAVVPLIAAIAGNSNANVDSVIFSFDTAGVLTDYRQSRASAPAPPAVETSAAANPDKPAGSVKPRRSASEPWNMRFEAAGQRENR